jgi:WD40 repeat protein
VWDAQTGQVLLSVKGGGPNVAYSPDGKRLASASDDRAARVWDAQTGQLLLALEGLTGQVHCVAFSPDGKRLAGGAQEVKVWDVQTGKELLAFQGHTSAVNSVVFSPDGTRLASGGGTDGAVKIWDATTSPEALTFSARNVSGVVFSPDGKRLAGGAADEKVKAPAVKVWDAQTGQELLSLKGHTTSVASVALSPDGKRLASGSGTWDATGTAFVSGEVKLWDAQTGQEMLTLKGHTAKVVSLAFSPDSKRLASGSGDDGRSYPPRSGEVKVWDVQTGQELLSIKNAYSVAFSPDGKRLATARWPTRDATTKARVPGEIKVWDAQTGQELLSLKVRGGDPMAFSPDGKRLASTSNPSVSVPPGGGGAVNVLPGEFKVWDAQTGQELLTFQGRTGGPFASLVFSPNGRRLASSSGGEVKVWDAQTGLELLTFKGGGSGRSVAFSPDGHRFVSSGGGRVTIFDATPLPEKP